MLSDILILIKDHASGSSPPTPEADSTTRTLSIHTFASSLSSGAGAMPKRVSTPPSPLSNNRYNSFQTRITTAAEMAQAAAMIKPCLYRGASVHELASGMKEATKGRHTLSSEKLVTWEVRQLNAHDIGGQSDGPFVVLHLRGKPGSADCLRASHAHLGPNNSSCNHVSICSASRTWFQ